MPLNPEVTDDSSGAAGASAPRVPGVPTYVVAADSAAFTARMGDGAIYVTWDDSGNADEVCYSVRVTTGGSPIGYVQADGTVDAGEVFQTHAAWGATELAITGLTDFTAYTVAARARNQDQPYEYSAWTDESAVMMTVPAIDYGIEQTDGEEFLPTSANVRVDSSAAITPTGSAVTETTETDYYGDITIPYTALGHDGDVAQLEVQYNEYKSGAWQGWQAATIYASPTGDGAADLATSEAGTAHTAVWNGCADAGNSENCPVKFRLRLQDEAAQWSGYVETEQINYRNLPAELVFYNASATPGTEGYSWDDDTTPTFEAAMPALRGGSVAFPEIYIYDFDAGTVLVDGYPRRSVESLAGWEYKVGAGSWTAMPVTGIPSNATYIRYTVQAAYALTANTNYIITGRCGEVRDLG